MSNDKKLACLLYRTDTRSLADELEMRRQRNICLTFAKEMGWLPIREFWENVDTGNGSEKSDDALLELRAGAEQEKFEILLVSEFARIGRVPIECSFAAAFFERIGVEVWDTIEGHIGIHV